MSNPLALRTAAVAAAVLLLATACADSATEPSRPAGEVALAKGGPNQLPTSGGKIVFSSFMTGNWDLFSVSPDGSGLRRLSFGSENETQPALSADGKKIAYLRQSPGSVKYDLWIMNIDGTRPQLRLATPENVTNIHAPLWSPDGRTITYAYLEGVAPFGRRIATVDARSGALVTLGASGRFPTWSPDRQWLAYTQPVDTTEQLFISRPDGSELVQRTDFGLCCGMPRWSPDGTRILVVARDGLASATLRVVYPAGGWSELVTSASPSVNAAWSPDAAKIAFADGAGDLWVSLANGAGATRIVEGADALAGLTWSR